MIVIPFSVLSLASVLFVWRLLRGPSTSDRVVALDGLLAVVMSGMLVTAVQRAVPVIAVALVALVGFIATGALARYIERRGG